MVKIWQRTSGERRERPNRIKKMSESEIKQWLNTVLMELGYNYDQWMYHDASPVEMDRLLELATDLWEELKERS